MKPQTHKEKLQQRNRLGTVTRKTGGGGGCVWGGEGGAMPILLARNLTLNSDASPNKK